MKYVLKNTAWRPDTQTVEELYIRDIASWVHTTKLSDARLWDNFDELADLVESEKVFDAKIVSVTDKELFEARLKDG